MKKITTVGRIIEFLGLLSAVINGIIFILVILSNPLSILIPVGYFLNTIIGVIFVILGGKIRKNQSSNIKSMLLTVLIISLIILVLNLFLSNNSASLFVPAIVILSTIVGLSSSNKPNN